MELWHVVHVSVRDNQPQVSWSVFNTADEAYVNAAYALKRFDGVLGYFIGCKSMETNLSIVETYLPLGGPHRFDMKRVGARYEIFFDGVCLTCIGKEA